jgi:uncharacterized protein (TIGR02145 family)
MLNNLIRYFFFSVLISLVCLNNGCDSSTEPEDCAGESGGNAYIDDCGVCISEGSGLIENYLMDCAGNCNGDMMEDCNEECNGSAFLNMCGVCVEGSTGLNENHCGQVIDMDGNIYETVAIGDQIWMAENLKVTHYNNGDIIQSGLNGSEWLSMAGTESGAFSIYEENIENMNVYGALYNWFTVSDGRGVCPEEWNVPTIDDWSNLIDYSGGIEVAGGKLKALGTIETASGLWFDPNLDASNDYGFSGLPSGFRHVVNDGFYSLQGSVGYFWSSTEYNDNGSSAYGIGLRSNTADVWLTSFNEGNGFSVRCVKD